MSLSWFLQRYDMATNGIDVQDMKRLDGHIEITEKYPIACGGYADIYPGVWTGRNVAVAIKVFRDAHIKAHTPEGQRKYSKLLNKEYRVWALLRHTNVLPLYGLIDDQAIPSTGIVAPRCTLGDLRAFFSDPARASVERLPIVKGIAEGLTYVHGEKVVHGDMTMNNVLIQLINGKFTPRISDFGRTRVLEIAGYTSSIGGAVHRHLPPEILTAENEKRTTKAFTQPADVWCFSMVMLETLTGKIPFWYMIELQAANAVAYGNEKPKQKRYPAFLHDQSCWDIMRRCWHIDPSQREKMPGLLQSLNDLT